MADPFNPTLIAEYMTWEKANAIKQIEEVERLVKEHRREGSTRARQIFKNENHSCSTPHINSAGLLKLDCRVADSLKPPAKFKIC